MSGLPFVRPVSIRHSIAGALRTALREGRFKFGEDLSEQKLATEMNVSRGPVREALLVLTEEGLITHSPNRGFAVLEFTAHDRAEIDQVRLSLETLTLELARGKFSPEELEELQRLMNEVVRLFEDSQYPARDSAEMAFHQMIWAKSGNKWLENSLKRIMTPYFTYSRFLPVIAANRPDPDLILQQHQRYVNFVRGKSKYSAEDCVRFHLRLGRA